MNLKYVFLVFLFAFVGKTYSQAGIPVYSDYLSDNYYLLHPSMAGASNCAKIRLTGRKQWFGQEDAPELQTLSFNGKLDDFNGAGIILFNDKNGYHAQKGLKLSYAHHLLFSRDYVDLNMLSFGVSAGFVQSALDQSTFFDNNPGFDPLIFASIQKDSYFNMDIGASYNYLEFYAHFTAKNILATSRDLYSTAEPVDLKRLILNTGYSFGDADDVLWEPSIMFQYITQTQEKTLDINFKAYKNFDFGQLWGGLSYRTSIDGAEYIAGNSVSKEKLQYITPVLGATINNFVISYTYSHFIGEINFEKGGYHQITLGLNLFCQREKYHCNCPAIN